MLDRLKTSSKYVYRAAHPAVKRCSQDNAAPMKKPRASLSPLTAPRHEGLRHSSVSPLQKKKKKNQKKKNPKIPCRVSGAPRRLLSMLLTGGRASTRSGAAQSGTPRTAAGLVRRKLSPGFLLATARVAGRQNYWNGRNFPQLAASWMQIRLEGDSSCR